MTSANDTNRTRATADLKAALLKGLDWQAAIEDVWQAHRHSQLFAGLNREQAFVLMCELRDAAQAAIERGAK